MVPDLEHLTYEGRQVEAKGKGLLNTWLVTENANYTPRVTDKKSRSTIRAAAKKKSTLQDKVENELNKDSKGKKKSKDHLDDWGKKATLSKSGADLKSKLQSQKKLSRQNSRLVSNVNLFSLGTSETTATKSFRLEKVEQMKWSMFVGTISAVIIYFLLTIVTILAYVAVSGQVPDEVLISTLVILGLILMALIISVKLYTEIYYPWLMVLILGVMSFLAVF